MNERETYESVKRDIKKPLRAFAPKCPKAHEHIVMDDEKLTFAYTGDGRISLEQRLQ